MYKSKYRNDRVSHALVLGLAMLLFIAVHHSYTLNKHLSSKGVSETNIIQNSDGILSSAYVLPQLNENSLVSKIIPTGSLPGNSVFPVSTEKFFQLKYSAFRISRFKCKQGAAWLFAYLHIVSSQGDASPFIS